MNTELILKLLNRLLGSIRFFDGFVAEFCRLIAGAGVEERVIALLTTRLRQLGQLGLQATRLEEFEPIEGGVYSMHLSGRNFNLRILYGFLPNREPVLLLPFYERGGKRKTDYTQHLGTAKARLAVVKEAFEDGRK